MRRRWMMVFFAATAVMGAAAHGASADGGASISTAPVLPLGQPVNGSSDGAVQFWRATLNFRDKLVLDTTALDIGRSSGESAHTICFYRPSVTDFTFDTSSCSNNHTTDAGHKREVVFSAPAAGLWTITFSHCMSDAPAARACAGNPFTYEVSARVLTFTRVALAAPTGPVLARQRLTLSGVLTGPAITGQQVAVQVKTKTKWATISVSPVGADGAFSAATTPSKPGPYVFRALYVGDDTHQKSSATRSVKVLSA